MRIGLNGKRVGNQNNLPCSSGCIGSVASLLFDFVVAPLVKIMSPSLPLFDFVFVALVKTSVRNKSQTRIVTAIAQKTRGVLWYYSR